MNNKIITKNTIVNIGFVTFRFDIGSHKSNLNSWVVDFQNLGFGVWGVTVICNGDDWHNDEEKIKLPGIKQAIKWINYCSDL